MTDPDRHPDSPPADRPSDLERALNEDRGGDDVEREEEGETPLEPTVSPDTAGGAGGTVRNQDETAQ